MGNVVYIALGSNIEPQANIERALRLLHEWTRITGLSRFYETQAIGPVAQPHFLNGVVRVETDFSPRALKFELLRTIESAVGRTRSEDRFAPRTMDLDIVLYGSQCIATPEVTVPDPDLMERPFLAAGILDIDPAAELPDGRLVAALFDSDTIAGLVCDNEFSRRMKQRFLK